MKNFLLAIIILLVPSVTLANDLVDSLQKVSVTVQTNSGSGSGVIRTRLIDKDSVNFIITAAHVVDSLRTTKKVVDTKSGTE